MCCSTINIFLTRKLQKLAKMVGRSRKDHFFCSFIFFLLERTKPQYQFLLLDFLLLEMQCFPSVRASGELGYIFCCWHYCSSMLRSSVIPFAWIFLVRKWGAYWHTLRNYFEYCQWSTIWRWKMLGLLKGHMGEVNLLCSRVTFIEMFFHRMAVHRMVGGT